MPRDFIQVFRGEITNTEVESQGEETVYEGATYVQKQQLWESGCGGDYDPTFIIPPVREWFIISRPKKWFWVNTSPTLSSHWENHRHHFTRGTHLPGLDSCPVSSPGGQRQRSESQVFPLTTLHIAKWDLSLLFVIISHCLFVRIFLHPLLSSISPCTHLYHWWHPDSENG